MPNATFKSYILVAVQFAMLLLLALTGPWIARHAVYLVLEIIGGMLGLWSVWTMRIGNFNIRPEVKATGRLVRSGPYHWIRHPMYTAILLVALALILDHFTPWRLLYGLILLLDLLVKSRYEERLLTAHFKDYDAYSRQTKRLLPWVY